MYQYYRNEDKKFINSLNHNLIKILINEIINEIYTKFFSLFGLIVKRKKNHYDSKKNFFSVTKI